MKMRRLLTGILAGVFTLSMATIALAEELPASDITHEVETSLNITSEFTVIYTGDDATLDHEVSLKAVTPKTGSYVVSEEYKAVTSDGDVESVTLTAVEGQDLQRMMVDGVDSYVTNLTFKASKAGIYTVKYTLTQGAGKSDVKFVGTATSDSITVKDPVVVKLTGAKLKITSDWDQQGKSSNYKARAEIYAVYSNGTEVYTGMNMDVVVEKNSSKDITVKIDDKNSFSVNVVGPIIK